jgi:hypothetical protein
MSPSYDAAITLDHRVGSMQGHAPSASIRSLLMASHSEFFFTDPGRGCPS